MKIIHIGKYYPPFHGGMENYLNDLAEQQTQSHDVTAIVHNHKFKRLFSLEKTENINKVKVIRLKTLRPILFTPLMLGLNKVVKRLLNNQHKDNIIHISWPNPSALLLLFNKSAKKTPWVIQWQSDMVTQNSSWLLKSAYFLFKPFEKKLLKQASAIIVSSQEYLNYSNALEKYKEKCHIIPLGQKQKPATFSQQDKKWAQDLWQAAQYKVYHIGRLTFYKNQKLLIAAAKLLPEAKFIITGSGDLESKLKQLIEENQLENVVLTGSLSHNKLLALLATCDAFCLPSNDRAESYGMVLIEALALHKNIIVSNLKGSGMRWIASTTPLGHVFDCNDAGDLVNKIKQINSLKSQVPLPKCFTIEDCANSIDKIYLNLK